MPGSRGRLAALDRRVVGCAQCERLVRWRQEVEPRAAFAGDTYWRRPVPGFGPPDARLLVVGLAPAAHGANRTGRMFTGDRSGDWLYRALFRAGFASRPESSSRDDGLVLGDCRITSVVHCAPPANKPTPAERDRCLGYLEAEMSIIGPEVIVALGGFAWDGTVRAARGLGWSTPTPRPRFGHLAEAAVGAATMIGSFHPSQQNTFTGRLTEPMFDAVFERVREVLEGRR